MGLRKATLFMRSHRGLIPTEAGRFFVRDVRYIIQHCNDSVTRARRVMQHDEMRIRIGSSPMTPAQVLVNLWPKLEDMDTQINFQVVPFENTPENAQEILAHLGSNVDVVAGIFDETMLYQRRCQGIALLKVPICCAVPVHHELFKKDMLTVEDLYGETLMLICEGWNHYVDELRHHLNKKHHEIKISDFDFYDTEVFNQCDRTGALLVAIPQWKNVHPLLKIIPVQWEFAVPYGILYGYNPSKPVRQFLNAISKITDGFIEKTSNEKVNTT